MKKWLYTALMVTLLWMALLSAFLLRGSFVHEFLVHSVGIYLGAPWFLFLIAWGLIRFVLLGGISSGLKHLFCISIMIAGAFLVSLGVGTLIHQADIRGVRQFVERIVPQLEEYKRAHGQYPESLTLLLGVLPPELFKEPDGYRVNADGFRFEYRDTAELIAGYCFDSSTREWHSVIKK